MPVPPTAGIECVIRAQADKGFIKLEAVVRSTKPVAGQYSFFVAKRSSTGESDNAQSGAFALQDKQEQVLTTLILDRSAIGHYRSRRALSFGIRPWEIHVHFTLKGIRSLRAGLIATSMLAASPAAFAQSAYITQVNPRSPGFTSTVASQSRCKNGAGVPSTTPRAKTGLRSHAGNGDARPQWKLGVQTLSRSGSFNRVFQSQSGGNNFSNVGVIGGKNNNVGVFQGGGDLSNLDLINTQGLTIDVLQPRGAAPINMLIARLPNGSLLIKR